MTSPFHCITLNDKKTKKSRSIATNGLLASTIDAKSPFVSAPAEGTDGQVLPPSPPPEGTDGHFCLRGNLSSLLVLRTAGWSKK